MGAITLNEPSNIPVSLNDSLWIKKFFLNFLQAYFAEHSKYTWSLNTNSKLLIVDKYAMDLEIVSNKPALVLSRGYYRWYRSSIGQTYSKSLLSANTRYTDLIAGVVTINCMAKNGIVCEELAATLSTIFTGYKATLKRNGLHSIDAIVVEEERVMSVNSDIDLTVVPVTIQFTRQAKLQYVEDFYSTNLLISFSGTNYGGYSGVVISEGVTTLQLYENAHYIVWASGFVFASGLAPPTGSTLSLTYIDASSLQDINETPSGIIDGVNLAFGTSYKIYGDYPIVSETLLTISNIGTPEDPYATEYDYYQNKFNWHNFDSALNIINGENGNLNVNVLDAFTLYPYFFYDYYSWDPIVVNSGFTSQQRIKITDKFTFAMSYRLSSYTTDGTLFTIGDETLNRLSVYTTYINNTAQAISVIYENESGRLAYVAQVSGIVNDGTKIAASIDLANTGITLAYVAPNSYVYPNYITVTGILADHLDVIGILSTGIANPYLTIGGIWGAAQTHIGEFRFYGSEIFTEEELYTIASELEDVNS